MVLTVAARHHAKAEPVRQLANGAAVHGIGLVIVGKGHLLFFADLVFEDKEKGQTGMQYQQHIAKKTSLYQNRISTSSHFVYLSNNCTTQVRHSL
ncbi:hypothetical protein SAMN05216323_108416 [Williamwhitmania taraxaci]|uniref:Uncharacterized protein n=1 Tax=Williamwhitmania taraxaci TaxID=1640674 RepID=A0A1G6S0I6_9BACT|nr:hypothetical protein SAMN05216323_108416 [Williamwhitmania taraxaci]